MDKVIELTAKAKRLRKQGMTYAQIAKEIGKSYQTARAYVNRETALPYSKKNTEVSSSIGVLSAIKSAVEALQAVEKALRSIH